MIRRITLSFLELGLIVILLLHAPAAIVAIAAFLIARLVTHAAARLFPAMEVDGELILVFGSAAMALEWALWKSNQTFIDLLVGWFLISALSLIGYWFARWLIQKMR